MTSTKDDMPEKIYVVTGCKDKVGVWATHQISKIRQKTLGKYAEYIRSDLFRPTKTTGAKVVVIPSEIYEDWILSLREVGLPAFADHLEHYAANLQNNPAEETP